MMKLKNICMVTFFPNQANHRNLAIENLLRIFLIFRDLKSRIFKLVSDGSSKKLLRIFRIWKFISGNHSQLTVQDRKYWNWLFPKKGSLKKNRGGTKLELTSNSFFAVQFLKRVANPIRNAWGNSFSLFYNRLSEIFILLWPTGNFWKKSRLRAWAFQPLNPLLTEITVRVAL